jgi:hypothetical protein
MWEEYEYYELQDEEDEGEETSYEEDEDRTCYY